MIREEAIKALLRCYSIQELTRRDEMLAALASITKGKCFRAARNLVLEAIKEGAKNEA
jgi:hypothetical protein